MKCKLSIGIFVVLVSMIMLMSNTLATLGPVWINQATLSVVDYSPDEDPENSGYGALQVSVWEHWNGVDWDVWMKYSNFDGALGTWVFPPVHPAITGANELNPAVTVTNADFTGVFEIHVVYESDVGPFPWNIYHTYTLNGGLVWSAPSLRSGQDAHDPAIVYAEDPVHPAGPWYGMAVEIVWSELRPATGLYDIMYDAWCYDPTWGVVGGWFYVGATVIQASTSVGGTTTTCERPEIAAVDETQNVLAWDYYFAIVWQETTAVANPPSSQIDIYYSDGITTVTPYNPGPPPVAPTGAAIPSAPGIINANPAGSGDCYDPDIAATQDYTLPAAGEQFYFHVNWVYMDTTVAPPTYQIDTTYNCAANPTPGAGALLIGGTAPAIGPAAAIIRDRPTIATKLIGLGPSVFETWMCWEENGPPGVPPPDIWYRMGQHTVGGPAFAYMVPAALVPYIQPVGSTEFNPELWNRNDVIRPIGPPFTHLVFDMTTGLGGNQEVEYIDP